MGWIFLILHHYCFSILLNLGAKFPYLKSNQAYTCLSRSQTSSKSLYSRHQMIQICCLRVSVVLLLTSHVSSDKLNTIEQNITRQENIKLEGERAVFQCKISKTGEKYSTSTDVICVNHFEFILVFKLLSFLNSTINSKQSSSSSCYHMWDIKLEHIGKY